MEIEVWFTDKIGPYKNGQVAFFDENNKFLRAILKGKKAVVLNPPDWEFEDVDLLKPAAPVVPILVKGTKEEIETIQKVAPGLASSLVVKEEVKKYVKPEPKVEETVKEENEAVSDVPTGKDAGRISAKEGELSGDPEPVQEVLERVSPEEVSGE